MGISTFEPNASESWELEDEAEGEDKLPEPSEQAAMESVFELLRQETRIDFSRYRKTTIMRRVTRRMSLNRQASLSGYVVQLRENAAELRQLRDDLLLSITEFFRDPEVFEMLQSRVFPALVENRSPKSPIRVWVPGCATGEEVYSLAIGFQEFMEEQRLNVAVQFFGTDISEKNIVRARAATYSSKVTQQVSAARVERYFEKVGDKYRVTKSIRERCVFATQDLGSDPPFANIDLVSCRNVLIYFDEELQGVATSLFYFALNTSGFLLLGVSESLQNFDELFAPVEGGGNLFRKRVPPLRRVQNLAWTGSGRSRGVTQLGRPRRTDEPREGAGVDWPEGLAERVIVEEYGPPGVVVDSHLQIRQFRGRVSVYLEPSTGSASLKLSKMVRAELMPDVFVAVEEAKRTRASAKRSNVGCTIAQDTRTRVDIVVFPLCQEGNEIHYLILFETARQEGSSSESAWRENVAGEVNTELFLLRRELKAVKHQLQAIIEEKEIANQDLWSANEEIQSANEELQSVNEEMEAAKEELESANEELVTLNEELQLKNLALSESEGRFRGLVETSIDWIWETDSDGVLTYSSPRVRELLGYGETEVVGRGLADLLPQVATSVFRASGVNDDIGVIQVVASALNRQGAPVVFDTSCVQKAANGAGGLRGVSRDVSERERVAERLRRSQESLARAQEIAKLGHWELDLQGSDNLWSAQMYRMLDWDEASGPPSFEQFLEIVHPEDRASVVASIGQVVKTGTAFQHEWRTNLKHGTNRTFGARVMPVRNAAGVLHKLVGTAMDVTEQRKATSDLQASELRFRTYIESAPDAILVTDEQGTVLEANQAAVQIGGYPREVLIGAPLLQFVVPEEHLRFETEFVEVQRTGRFSGEFSFRLASGGDRVGQMEAVKLSDVRFLIFAKDVTRHRDAEASLHAAREHLHHAEKMQAIGQLAGGIAHDFNNQLTTVLSFTELLLGEVQIAQHTSYCEQIIGGIKRASELTAQLLAYSRKGKYQSVVVDVHRMSEEVSSLLQRTIDKKVEVVLNLRALENSTLGDPTQLQNALLNLALNARDAMESGGKLTIATRVVSGRSIPALGLLGTLGLGRYLELSVTDTGTGMAEDVKKRVFEPFFSTKSPGKGLGMGLPSVYGAVISHQGAMRMESELGQGSKFVIYLPVAPTQYEAQGVKAPTRNVPRISARIMLVEDEPTLRSAMCAVLSHLGHGVKAFAGGRDAVEHYRECWAQVDLVILDMIMPGMNGRETFVALKDVNPNVVVLLASGYSLEGETEELLRNGVRGFLQKPFEKDRLAKAVLDALTAQSTSVQVSLT